jgi:hypothetical protein
VSCQLECRCTGSGADVENAGGADRQVIGRGNQRLPVFGGVRADVLVPAGCECGGEPSRGIPEQSPAPGMASDCGGDRLAEGAQERTRPTSGSGGLVGFMFGSPARGECARGRTPRVIEVECLQAQILEVGFGEQGGQLLSGRDRCCCEGGEGDAESAAELDDAVGGLDVEGVHRPAVALDV